MSLEKQLGLKFPIYWGDWPIEEKFARYLIQKIKSKRPVNVVELGSGTSTLIIAKTLEKLGYKYSLVSFDSDKEFLEQTKKLMLAENIYDEMKVKLVFSPIKNLAINNNLYRWYDLKDFEFDFDKIDLLFVDGPVGNLCKNARYPAVEIMKKYLKEGSVLILHDAKRIDEKEIVKMWKKENNKIKNIYSVETDRGGVEIQF